MITNERNKIDFKNELSAIQESTGQLGFKVGKKFAMHTFLPLTNYLVNTLWKERAGDSAAISFAKTAARAMTYFFSAVTLAPVFQSLFYGLPKRLYDFKQHSDYAKESLTALRNYNTERNKVIIDQVSSANQLSPEGLADHSSEMVVRIDDQQRMNQLTNAADGYCQVIDGEVDKLVPYLKGLTKEERLQAHREILGAFMTHVGFEDVFKTPDQRLDFAVRFSNKICEKLAIAQAKEMVQKLSPSYNFIRLNRSIDQLSKEFAETFGLEEKTAAALLTSEVKKEIIAQNGSVETFKMVALPRLSAICREEDKEFQALLDAAKHEFKDKVATLDDKFLDLEHLAIILDIQQGAQIRKTEISRLKKDQRKFEREIATIDGKLNALGNRKEYYYLQKIEETETQLLERKKDAQAELVSITRSLNEKEKLIAALNNRNGIDFNGAEIQALRAAAKEALSLERSLLEANANKGPQNIRAFRAFMELMKGVDETEDSILQEQRILELTQNLSNNQLTYKTRMEKIKSALGFGEIRVSMIDAIRENLNSGVIDASTFRESIKALYEAMTPAQQARFESVVGRQAGFGEEAQLQGKEILINFTENRDETRVEIVKCAIRSDEGKKAVEYKPWNFVGLMQRGS